MKKISWKLARRVVAFNVAVIALVVIGLFVQGNVAGTSRQALASSHKLQAVRDALSGDSGGQSEGPVGDLQQEQYEERAYPAADIPANAYVNGAKQYNLVTNFTGGMNWQLVGPTYAPGASYHDYYTYKALASSGRVNALAAVPSSCHVGGCSTVYLGAANGGVWKTTDGGQTWRNVFSTVVNSAIGSLAVDPKNENIVYVGTGEANFSIDSNRGLGIYRSTDGGGHWSQLGGVSYFANRAITGLIIDPRTAGTTNATLYVTTASGNTGASTIQGGNSTVPSLPNRGFYKSTNGGQTWTHSNPTSVVTTGVYTPPSPGASLANMPAHSLVMDPNNPNVLYAAYTATGVFKSVNDGATWTELTNGLPAASKTDASARYTLAMAPDLSNVLYVAYNAGSERIYKSANVNATTPVATNTSLVAGPVFTKLNAPNACSGQCWYDMPLAVAPGDTAVYAGGQASYNGYTFCGYGSASCPNFCPTFHPYSTAPYCSTSIMKSTDGGLTWTDISANDMAGGAAHTGGGVLHPDDHVILINPVDASNVYTGNDGGISVTQNATNIDPTWKDLNRGLSTLQFQGLAVGPTGAIFGGTQDNGTFRLDPGSNGVAAHSLTGDGGQPMADPTNPNMAYYATTGTSLIRDDNVYCNGCDSLTKTWQDFGPFSPYTAGTATNISDFGSDSAQFYAPHAIDTAQPTTIFEGTNRILRSFNRGGTNGNPSVNDASSNDDLSDSTGGASTNGSIPGNWAPLSNSSSFGGGNVAAIATSPVDPNVLAVATTLGRIYYTTNALANVSVDNPTKCDGRQTSNHRIQCKYVSGINWREIDGIVLVKDSTGNLVDVGATPNRFPSSLSFVPGSTSKLYVTFSGFNENTRFVPGHIFEGTVGAGPTSWKRIDGSGFTILPNIPFSSMVANPNKPGHLYAAGDIGTFFSPDNGAHWLRSDYGLPNTPVYQLVFDRTNNTLLAATHGNAIWRASAP